MTIKATHGPVNITKSELLRPCLQWQPGDHLWNNSLTSNLILKFKVVASPSPCTVKFHKMPTDSWEKRKENKKK